MQWMPNKMAALVQRPCLLEGQILQVVCHAAPQNVAPPLPGRGRSLSRRFGPGGQMDLPGRGRSLSRWPLALLTGWTNGKIVFLERARARPLGRREACIAQCTQEAVQQRILVQTHAHMAWAKAIQLTGEAATESLMLCPHPAFQWTVHRLKVPISMQHRWHAGARVGRGRHWLPRADH